MSANASPDSPSRATDWAIGLAVYGTTLTGVLGILGALIAFLAQQWLTIAGCLVASALAFGLLANSLIRRG